MDSATKQQKLNQIKHEAREKGTLKEDKHIIITVQEMEKYDWNPSMRFLLLILILGTRTDSEAWIQEDCPKSAAEMVGWCDMAQWRLAQRVGLTEDHVQGMLKQLEADGFIEIVVWTDSNNARHGMYRVIEDTIRANERPSHKSTTPRAPRYKEKRKANKGSFSYANQPGKNRGAREMDDE